MGEHVCENHTERPATHSSSQPSAEKGPNGDYRRTVYVCAECAERLEHLGWSMKALEDV